MRVADEGDYCSRWRNWGRGGGEKGQDREHIKLISQDLPLLVFCYIEML